MSLKTVDPKTLKHRLDEGAVVLVDIREPDEYVREHIVGAKLLPMSRLDTETLVCPPGKTVVFTCQSGNRTAMNAGRLSARGGADPCMLAGGLAAWKAAGLPTRVDTSAPIDLQRQVQLGAGSMVLIGVVLGLTVSPWFLGLSAFVGAGLCVAGATGFCGLARVLRHMPWNARVFAAAK
jgi:rhodanese-related sulfurtransferase